MYGLEKCIGLGPKRLDFGLGLGPEIEGLGLGPQRLVYIPTIRY